MRLLRRSTRSFLAAFVAATALAACSDGTPTPGPAAITAPAASRSPATANTPNTPGQLRDAVLAWNDVITATFHPPVFAGQQPPADARAYAMASVAMHDALNAIDRRYAPYAYMGEATEPVNGEATIAAAVHGVLASLAGRFAAPGPLAFVNAKYADAIAAIPDGAAKDAGIVLGRAVAAATIAARTGDGSIGAATSPFTSPGTPGAFRPLVPNLSAVELSGLAAIQHWGAVRPFVIASPAQFRAALPYGAATLAEAVGTPEYLADYAETKAIGGMVSSRTTDQTHIGLFWVESSALGWNRVARTILERRQQTAWRTARILALMHLAIADSYITNFESKYHYKFWRPVTAIRLGNMNPATPGDPTWNVNTVAAGLGGTPPVPEWPSAHAMGGAAAAEVLKDGIPGTTAFAMLSSTGRGIARSYPSVDAAVADNNVSRVYIGFHWRAATVEGERLGRLVGRYVVENALQQLRGDQ